MNLTKFVQYILQPVRLGIAGDGGGGGDSSAAAASTAATGADSAAATGSGAAGAAATSTGQQQAATGQQTASTSFISPDGKLTAGWSKALGLTQPADGVNPIEGKFTSVEALAKSYAALEKMNGNQNKVAIPGKDASPEEVAAYRQKMGIPAKPEEYGLKMPEKIGDQPFPKELWNDDVAKSATELFHKLGITKEQAAALAEWNNTQGLAQFSGMKQQQETQIALAMDALKKEWGAHYTDKLATANEAAAVLGLDKSTPHLTNDPAFIRALAKVGEMIGEKPAAGVRGGSHAPADPSARINELRTIMTKPGYKNTAPGHADRLAELTMLTRQKVGEA